MNGSESEIVLLLIASATPYLYLMLRVFAGLRKLERYIPESKPTIKISVVIATNRSAADISPIINDLLLQNYDHQLMEVILADDSGGRLQHNDLPVAAQQLCRVIPNKGKGKKKAIRSGIEASSAELIITTDDDCHLPESWVKEIASFYSDKGADMILCPVTVYDNGTLFGKAQQFEFLSLQGVTAGSAEMNDAVMCNGAGMAFRRDLYPQKDTDISGKTLSGDDVFLLHYLKREGKRVAWLESENATVTTDPSPDPASFLRQRSRWASKAQSYSDKKTILTGASVLLISCAIITAAIFALFNPAFFYVALLLFIMKSIPDMLIINNRAMFHGKRELFYMFPLLQLIYPFYVIVTVTAGLFRTNRW